MCEVWTRVFEPPNLRGSDGHDACLPPDSQWDVYQAAMPVWSAYLVVSLPMLWQVSCVAPTVCESGAECGSNEKIISYQLGEIL